MGNQQVLVCLCFLSLACGQFVEDTGEHTLTSSNLGKDVTYVEIVNNKLYFPNVTLRIQLEDIFLNHHEGDLLIIGPGDKKNVFSGSPGWMFVESQKETHTFRVTGQNATVAFIPIGQSSERKVKIKWKRTGTETKEVPTTQIPTTPVSQADRVAIILCFQDRTFTCAKFNHPTTEKNFQIGLADEANRYAQKMNIELPRKIISTDIKVTCKELCNRNTDANNNNQTSSKCGNTFLIATITDRWNPELPVFTTEQLRKIIADYHSDKSLGVVECRKYPDYSWWLWGSGIMLVIIIIITVLCSKWSHYEMKCMEELEEKPAKVTSNGEVNGAYEHDDYDTYYETADIGNHVDSSLPNTANHQLPPKSISSDSNFILRPEINPLGTPNSSRRLPTSPQTDSNFILRPEINPLGTPNSSRRLPMSPQTENNHAPKFGMNPRGTPNMNSSRKFVTPTVREDLIMETIENSPELPRPRWTKPKEIEPDAVSRSSTHLYEDLDYLRLKLRQPSPTLSLRKQEDENDEDTEL